MIGRFAENIDDGQRQQHLRNEKVALSEIPWLCGRVPNGYWSIRKHRRLYMAWLSTKCGFGNPEDWYRIRKHHFNRNSGGGLLRNQYGCSVQAAVAEFLPEVDWKPWLFGAAPNGFWKDVANRRNYMQWLGQQLDFRCAENWYGVTAAHFHQHHGGGLLNNEFRGSVQAVLRDYLPKVSWKQWLFSSVPQRFWQDVANRRSYLNWLGEKLGYRTVQDWKSLSQQHFLQHNGSALLLTVYKGSVRKAVEEFHQDSVLK